MKILVSNNDKLKTLQDSFSKIYPLLKIEFYKNSHKEMEGNLKNEQIDNNLTIKSLNSNIKDFEWDIDSNSSVHKFENDFLKLFDFNVQVFRKNKNVWIQTTNSDSWTLEEQQKHAEEMSTSTSENEEFDYHEQE